MFGTFLFRFWGQSVDLWVIFGFFGHPEIGTAITKCFEHLEDEKHILEGMGQIWAGASWQRRTEWMVKDSMGGQRLNEWSRAQRVAKDSTGGQSIFWKLDEYKWLMNILICCYHVRINSFQNCSKICQSINIADKS